jgi:hypothetical protein
MRIDYKKAAQLCNAGEFRLVEQSRPNNVAQLNLRDAKRRAQQARKQFDKWSQLSIKQNRQRGKGSGQTQERTEAKRDLFREILNRFEGQQKKIEVAEAAAAKRRMAATKKPAAGARKSPLAGKSAKGSPPKGKGTPNLGFAAPKRAQGTKDKGRVTRHRIKADARRG